MMMSLLRTPVVTHRARTVRSANMFDVLGRMKEKLLVSLGEGLKIVVFPTPKKQCGVRTYRIAAAD